MPTLSGAALGFPHITITPNSDGPDFELSSMTIPQRIRIPYDIGFTIDSLPAFPGMLAAPLEDELDAAIIVRGKTFNASTELEFVSLSAALTRTSRISIPVRRAFST
jgi:hypothetical protein